MAKPDSLEQEIFPVAAVDAAIAGMRGLLARAEDRGFAAALETIHPGAAVAPPPQALPVCRHLPAALAAAGGTPAEPLAAALAELAAAAYWAQNPNYRQRPPSGEFLDGYGYFVLAGPADGPPSFIECPELACGLLLLGPGTLYPAHRHPAVELYVPLTDEGEWQSGDEPWRRQPAGTLIHHESGVPHAMRAGGTPLLAAYLWRGELATHARIAG